MAKVALSGISARIATGPRAFRPEGLYGAAGSICVRK